MLRKSRSEAQQVVDLLWSEKLIPFALIVGKVTKQPTEYVIYFYDSRIHSVHVPLDKDHSFKDTARTAVLARIKKMSGPLADWKA